MFVLCTDSHRLQFSLSNQNWRQKGTGVSWELFSTASIQCDTGRKVLSDEVEHIGQLPFPSEGSITAWGSNTEFYFSCEVSSHQRYTAAEPQALRLFAGPHSVSVILSQGFLLLRRITCRGLGLQEPTDGGGFKQQKSAPHISEFWSSLLLYWKSRWYEAHYLSSAAQYSQKWWFLSLNLHIQYVYRKQLANNSGDKGESC